MNVRPGIDVLLDHEWKCIHGADVGAVVHPASILRNWTPTADALLNSNKFRLVSLFGPQHGARGEKQDNMIESEQYHDPDLGIPVHSLYGDTRIPTEEMMQPIDALLFDLQDVGTRVYTFIHTMSHCMQACARYRKKMVVLDRPNPITGKYIEGNLLQLEFRSFVGLWPIPMRHGMTTGEMAQLLNSEFDIHCDLTVIAMEGWRREAWFDETGLPWIQPSPNLPTLDSAIVYPGTVLFEGTQISEGRGTTRPFETIGAPYIHSRPYAEYLNNLKLPGVYFQPVYFQPTFHKWSGEMCGGVQIHVTNRDSYEPVITGIAALTAAGTMYPDLFNWREPPYEYEFEKLPIEILCGCRDIPEMIKNGVTAESFRQYWKHDLEEFARKRGRYLLYR